MNYSLLNFLKHGECCSTNILNFYCFSNPSKPNRNLHNRKNLVKKARERDAGRGGGPWRLKQTENGKLILIYQIINFLFWPVFRLEAKQI